MARPFTACMKEFFGYLPGQSLTEFGQELKKLSYEDKLEFAEGLRQNGLDCQDPTPPIAAS